MTTFTPRQRFIRALERKPITGRVPHFELVFYLTMQAFGRVHPTHRHYGQWDQMEEKERQLHREDIASIYIQTAERFGHDAIFIHDNPGTLEECLRIVDVIREKSGDRYFLMRHGDATFSIPDGNAMYDFSYRMADEPDKLHAEAQRMVDDAVRRAEVMAKHGGLDGFALCADYCLNQGPFLSPRLFSEFVTPYLARLIQADGMPPELLHRISRHGPTHRFGEKLPTEADSQERRPVRQHLPDGRRPEGREAELGREGDGHRRGAGSVAAAPDPHPAGRGAILHSVCGKSCPKKGVAGRGARGAWGSSTFCTESCATPPRAVDSRSCGCVRKPCGRSAGPGCGRFPCG